MPERLGGIDLINERLDSLNRVWSSFPKHLRPDVRGFRANLSFVYEIPKIVSTPPSYEGLRAEVKKTSEQFLEAYQVPQLIYTNTQTGETYINRSLFNEPISTIDYVLSYQVAIFTSTKAIIKKGTEFNSEERDEIIGFGKEFCDTLPKIEDLEIHRRGFQRQLVYSDRSGKIWYLGDIAPKGDWRANEEINLLYEIYPHAFALFTKLLGNRKNTGGVERLKEDLYIGGIDVINDLLLDARSFSGLVVGLLSQNTNDVWSILEGLLTGDIDEANLYLDPTNRYQGLILQGLSNFLGEDKKKEEEKNRITEISTIPQKPKQKIIFH